MYNSIFKGKEYEISYGLHCCEFIDGDYVSSGLTITRAKPGVPLIVKKEPNGYFCPGVCFISYASGCKDTHVFKGMDLPWLLSSY